MQSLVRVDDIFQAAHTETLHPFDKLLRPSYCLGNEIIDRPFNSSRVESERIPSSFFLARLITKNLDC